MHPRAHRPYRGTSLIGHIPPIGHSNSPISRVLLWSYGGVLYPMSEVPMNFKTHHPGEWKNSALDAIGLYPSGGSGCYRGTSLIRNSPLPPLGTTIGH